MTSFADIVLLASIAAACGAAESATAAPVPLAAADSLQARPAVAAPDSVTVPPALAGRIAETIAAAWSIDARALRLEWGTPSGMLPNDGGVPFRIVGSGADGWFVAAIGGRGEAQASVRVRAGTDDSVAVAARALTPGMRLEAGDIKTERRVHWGPPGAPSPRPASGWEVRRPLAAGDPLAKPAAVPMPAVFAGQAVRLEWKRGTIVVSVTGKALNTAAIGETVRIRPSGRSSSVTGIVTGEGQAVIGAKENG